MQGKKQSYTTLKIWRASVSWSNSGENCTVLKKLCQCVWESVHLKTQRPTNSGPLHLISTYGLRFGLQWPPSAFNSVHLHICKHSMLMILSVLSKGKELKTLYDRNWRRHGKKAFAVLDKMHHESPWSHLCQSHYVSVRQIHFLHVHLLTMAHTQSTTCQPSDCPCICMCKRLKEGAKLPLVGTPIKGSC